MTDKDQPSNIPGYHIDTRDTLSSADLLKFLLNDTSTKIAELWKDVKNELDLDRNHNNEVNKQIVEGLGKRIETLEKYVISSLDKRSSPPSSEEKQPTFSCYLCVESFHRLSSLDKHIKSNHPSLICVECGKTLRSKPDLYLHTHREHKETLEDTSQSSQIIVVGSPGRESATFNSFTGSQDNLNLSSVLFDDRVSLSQGLQDCDETFLTSPDLSPHQHSVQCEPSITRPRSTTEEEHSQLLHDSIPCQEHTGCFNCNDCGQTFRTLNDLQIHTHLNHVVGSPIQQDVLLQSEALSTPYKQGVTFSCYECEYLFLSRDHLVEHLQTKHGVEDIQICPLCENIFKSPEYLNLHKTRCHALHLSPDSNPLPFIDKSLTPFTTCSWCGFVAKSDKDMNEHMLYKHRRKVTVHCNNCEATFQDMRLLNIHMLEQHSQDESSTHNVCATDQLPIPPLSNQSLSPIPQFDGNDDEHPVDVHDVLAFPPLDITSASNTLFAPYQLNQQKQVAQLVRDANIPDFDLVTNDQGRNVCLQCSVGFYEAVAKPAMSTLSTGFSHSVDGVSIRCTLIKKTQDRNNSIPGLLLRFELSGDHVNPSPAPLSIHLHNTQRKIQIQGGASMPNQATPPVWFVENILRERFLSQAKAKAYSIDQINKLVMSASSTPQTIRQSSNSCGHCNKLFTTNAKPIRCTRCSRFKHSTKCSPCPPLQAITTIPIVSSESPVLSSVQSVTHVVSSSTVSSAAMTAAVRPELSITSTTTMPTPPTASMISLSSSIAPTIVCSATTGGTLSTPATAFSTSSLPSMTPAVAPVSSTSTLPISSHTTASVTGHKQPANKARQKKQTVLALTPEAAEIEFLKQELNNARTTITLLDTEVKDLNKTISIQRARLKIFEDQQNSKSSDQYIRDQETVQTSSCTSSGRSVARSCHTPSTCCNQPMTPCCCKTISHTHSNSLPQELLANVVKSVNKLSKDFEHLKSVMAHPHDPVTVATATQTDVSAHEPVSLVEATTRATTDNHTNEIIVEADIHETPQNMSTSSIEEFLPSPNHDIPLNYQVTTSQHSQLMLQ